MAEHFRGGLLVFDFVSEKGMSAGNTHVKTTDNAAKLTFSMENVEKEVPVFSEYISKVQQKSYMEGYPVPGVKCNLITKVYIKPKRDKYFVANVEFSDMEALGYDAGLISKVE
jgi:hypothetical protein